MAELQHTDKGWRYEQQKVHLLRAKWHDYKAPSIYMLTMTTLDRKPMLGKLCGIGEEAYIELTALGKAVAEQIEMMPKYKGFESSEIYSFVVMPDHIHVLLQVHETLRRPLGYYVSWFKKQCSDKAQELLEAQEPTIAQGTTMAQELTMAQEPTIAQGLNPASTTATEASTTATEAVTEATPETTTETAAEAAINGTTEGYALAAKSASSVPASSVPASSAPASSVPASPVPASSVPASPFSARTHLESKPKPTTPLVFETEYHDRILTHTGQLTNLKQYIAENPRRLALRRANPDLFRIRQNIRIGSFSCTTLGNQFLLDYPVRQVLQCSRSLTPEQIEKKKQACLIEADKGSVFVSAAISEGEKQICKALREAGYPLIILLQNGFPKEDDPHYRYFKPQGIFFETCAEGRLLLIEPPSEMFEDKGIEAQVYQKTGILPHDTLRYRFLALNSFAQIVANQ